MVQTEQTPSVQVEASQDRPATTWWRAFGNPRLPLLTFLAVEVVALVRVLALAPNKWFSYDEWEFLSGRTAGSLHSLFRPTIGHWMTLNILVYRGLYQLFGLRTYLPYVLVLVVLHLIAAALLFTIIRRIGVNPWIATVAASFFVLFGSGWQNILWAFQIGFVGAFVLGLVQLLLADHDGRIDRRDWLGLLAGAAALMFSGVGVLMVLVVGLAALVRRGWRAALFHTVPLAALYAVWWFGYGSTFYKGLSTTHNPGLLARWAWTGYRTSFEAMGQLKGVGIALAVLLVVGLVLAWVPLDLGRLRTRAAVPAALLVGAFIFVVAAGWQRQQFGNFKLSAASQSQYLYMFVAMAIPAFAVAADALARRWRWLWPVAIVPLVIGIPGNVEAFSSGPYGPVGLYQTPAEVSYRQLVVALANVPFARQVPRSTQIGELTGLFSPQPAPLDVSLGWLLDQNASGRLPALGNVDPRVEADATLSLALKQSQSPSGSLGVGAASLQSTPQSEPPPGASTPLVRIANNPKDGPIFVDSNGMTLYTLTVGTHPISCTGACAEVWHPLLAPQPGVTPAGGPGVSGLGTSASGTVVEYWGFPLYTYTGDKAPGQTAGNGIKSFGGSWQTIKVQSQKSCSALVAPTTRILQKGQSMTFTGALGVTYLSGKAQSDEVIFEPTRGQVLSALAGPLKLQLLPIGSTTSVCI
jgi:predicted lipoprotein with Yx(FWY)xxD motif